MPAKKTISKKAANKKLVQKSSSDFVGLSKLLAVVLILLVAFVAVYLVVQAKAAAGL